MNTKTLIKVFAVLLCCYALPVQGDCDSDQFVLKKGSTNYLVINSPTDVQTCGTNICDAINKGLQTIALDNGKLSITNGNDVTLPDASSTNEIQQLSVSTDGLTLSISNGNSVPIADNNSTNEIQTLSINGGKLQLSQGGGSVDLPDPSPTNEIQSLTLSNNQLSISDSNTVDFTYLAKPVLFRVIINTTTAIPRANYYPLPFNAVTLDTASGAAGSSYKAQVAGYYQAYVNLNFNNNLDPTAGYYAEVHFYINSASVMHCTYNAALSSYPNTLMGVQCTDIYKLNVNDVISTYVWWTSPSGSVNLSVLANRCVFTLQKISDP